MGKDRGIMSLWLLNAYMDAVMEVKMRMGRREESWDCLGSYMQTTWSCVVSEEGLRAMVGSFVGVLKKRSESQCS